MNRKILPQYKNGRLIPIMDMDPEDFLGERWIDIPGYESIYQLSDHGRLRTVDREIVDKNGVRYFRKGQMRTISIVETDKTVVSDTQGRKFIGINIIPIKDNNKIIIKNLMH